MHIVCPHCTTSYAINLATLGAGGRTVRCSRCKEVWLARPEDAVEPAPALPAMAHAGASESDAAAEWDALARDETGDSSPVVDSPSIAGDWPEDGNEPAGSDEADWQSMARDEASAESGRPRQPWFRGSSRKPVHRGAQRNPYFGLPTACAAMGALVLALIVWRAEMVRLM